MRSTLLVIDQILTFPFQRLAHMFQRVSGGSTNFWLANWFLTLALFSSFGATVRTAFLIGGIPASWFFLEATLIALLIMLFRLNGKAEDDETFRKERIRDEHTRPRVFVRITLFMFLSQSLYLEVDKMFSETWDVLYLYQSILSGSLIAGLYLNACAPLSGLSRRRS